MTPSSLPKTRRRLGPAYLLLIFCLALAVRLIHFNESLWCDEMTAFLSSMLVSWQRIVAPGAGDYLPNNHPLYGILARAGLYITGGISSRLPPATAAAVIRLPSLIAGAFIPVALAWPMRRSAPRLSVLLAILATLNPWLVAFSDEARGYSLMILFGIVATNLLPDGKRWRPAQYGIVVAAMIYTVPVAGVLLIAHGITLLSLRRRLFLAWMRGAAIAGGIACLLFMPMLKGVIYYYHHPLHTPEGVLDLINQLPRFAVAGEFIPPGVDPLLHAPMLNLFSPSWWIPVLLITLGTAAAWRQKTLRQPTMVMLIATSICLLTGLIFHEAAEVRFACWAAVWIILATAALAIWIYQKCGKIAAILAIALAIGWFGFRDVILLPSQPVRDAMILADTAVPANQPIVIAFLSAGESAALYGNDTVHQHPLLVVNDLAEFHRAERVAIQNTGSPPWVIMSFEFMPRAASPAFWAYLEAHYKLNARLSGRISSVAIYQPRN